MICPTCKNAGRSPASNACQNCGSAASFKLCPICSRGLDQCEICRAAMIGPAAGVYFVRLFDSDNGKKIHLNVADELQITLSEAPAATPYSWSVASYTKSVLAYTQSNGVADPNNPQLNIRTFIFCPRQPGQGEVKLQRGTQEWQCTVIVK